MPTINITGREFTLGESTSDYLRDGGFSPDSYGLNLTQERGVLAFAPSATTLGSGTIDGNPIAYAYDKNIGGNDVYYLDANGAFYYLNGTTVTKAQTAGGSQSFQLGTSDLIQFKGDTFATSDFDIVKLSGSDLTSIDSGWWSVTEGNGSLTASYRHPLERVEDKLYIADQNNIHTWDGTTSVADDITLPTDVNITSLRKHPNGRELLAFCGLTANFSHTDGQGGRIYLIDTVTKTFIREIDVEAQVEGTRNVGGIIYCTYGKNLGYFDGNGVTFIKRLDTSGTTYSHSMTNMEDILIVRDGLDVRAFGDLGSGKVWWKPWREGATISIVAYKGDNILTVANGTELVQIDYDNNGFNGAFYSNRYFFDDEAEITGIDIVHGVTDSDSGTTDEFKIYSRDTEDTENLIKTFTYNDNTATRSTTRHGEKVDFFQLKLEPSLRSRVYKMIRILFDGRESR